MIDCKYHCPRFDPPRFRRPEPERRKVAITGASGMKPGHWRYFYKMCDRATFGLVDPVILCWGWSTKTVDVFAANWAADNWLAMHVHYPEDTNGPTKKRQLRSQQKRDENVLGSSDYLLVFSNGKCAWSERLLDRAKSIGVRTKRFLF